MRLHMFHGSSFGHLHGFEKLRPPVFFTPDMDVATAYARDSVLATQRADGVVRERVPTVYSVTIIDPRPFDLREESHREVYGVLRKRFADPEMPLPKLESEGFIAPRTRLPSFSFKWPLWNAIKAAQLAYDSIWFDEGSQGISLALFDLNKARITAEARVE